MYCHECLYSLSEIFGSTGPGRCPECGAIFDPSDPSTYLESPRRSWSVVRILQAALAAYPALIVAALAANFWMLDSPLLAAIVSIGLLAGVPIGLICFGLAAATFWQRDSLWWRLVAISIITWLGAIVVLVRDPGGMRDSCF